MAVFLAMAEVWLAMAVQVAAVWAVSGLPRLRFEPLPQSLCAALYP
jgi:hypothetical protein